MGRSTREAWLQGQGDLKTATVEDVPAPGQTVLVRGLPAAYSNEAQSESLEFASDDKGRQSSKVNVAKLEVLQFAHGVVEPQVSVQDAEIIAQKWGPAFKKVVAKIQELSGLDDEAVKDTEARFPARAEDQEGPDGAAASRGR